MKTILLQHNLDEPKQLTQIDFGVENAKYIICSDYKIDESVYLPIGCELYFNGGSIKGGVIYLPFVFQKPDSTRSLYKTLAITCPGYLKTNGETITYTPRNTIVYLTDGCYIKTSKSKNYEIYVNTPCRIALPGVNVRGTLHIMSDKINDIQIDGECCLQIHAENCKFERIFESTDGWKMINRTYDNTDFNLFENCNIWSNDYPLSIKPDSPPSNFLCICTRTDLSEEYDHDLWTSESLNWLIVRDCIFNNIGIHSIVHADNCTFLFGENVNNNYETIHCGSHSRILNCTFDGRGKDITGIIPTLNADVIDTYNGHDIVIDSCTFVGYKYLRDNPVDVVPGRCMITVKSHYHNPTKCDLHDNPVASDCIGPQNGVIIRNCHFDLPDFMGYIIEPWNGLIDDGKNPVIPEDDRAYNRQFTVIEGNYINAPKSVGFVHCFGFTDYLTVRNNFGTIDRLVYIPDGIPAIGGNDKNVVHNLIIDGNILRFHPYDNPYAGMTILWGSHIDNLELTNNKVVGYLWGGLNNQTKENLSGTIRICNNETIGARGLFKKYTDSPLVMPKDLAVFFRGNVSQGVKTDVGPMELANDPTASMNFIGREFYCTDEPHTLKIFNGSKWDYCLLKTEE